MKDKIEKFKESVIAIFELENMKIKKTVVNLIGNNFEFYAKQTLKEVVEEILKEIVKCGATCPDAYGFEGKETFPDCGKCIICEAKEIGTLED